MLANSSLIQKYANDFKVESINNNSIIFMGQPGCGKTHLSLAIANYLMEKGVGVVYMNYREDMTFIKQNILDSVVYNKYLNRYKNAKVLIIDDLYKGTVTDADLNYMFQIVNKRYLNNLPFILSSEKTARELLDFDEAIGSRLLEQAKGNIVTITDKRLNHRIYN